MVVLAMAGSISGWDFFYRGVFRKRKACFGRTRGAYRADSIAVQLSLIE